MDAILGEALLEGEPPEDGALLPMTDDLGADLRAWFSLSSAGLGETEAVALARAFSARHIRSLKVHPLS